MDHDDDDDHDDEFFDAVEYEDYAGSMEDIDDSQSSRHQRTIYRDEVRTLKKDPGPTATAKTQAPAPATGLRRLSNMFGGGSGGGMEQSGSSHSGSKRSLFAAEEGAGAGKRSSLLGAGYQAFTSGVTMASSVVTSTANVAVSTVGTIGSIGNSFMGSGGAATGQQQQSSTGGSFFDRRPKPKHPPKNTKIASRELEIIKKCQEQMKVREMEESEKRALALAVDKENLRLQAEEAAERERVTREVEAYREMMKVRHTFTFVGVVVLVYKLHCCRIFAYSYIPPRYNLLPLCRIWDKQTSWHQKIRRRQPKSTTTVWQWPIHCRNKKPRLS